MSRTPTAPVWDSGLQPERTALAWRRLALALTVAALALPRVLWDSLAWAIPASLLCLSCASVIYVGAHHRYREGSRHLHASDDLPYGARLLLVPVLACLALGVAALASLP